MTVDVVPRVVTFAKHTPVIQLVVENESSRNENSQKSQEGQETHSKSRKRKLTTNENNEKIEKKYQKLKEGEIHVFFIITNMTLINDHQYLII